MLKQANFSDQSNSDLLTPPPTPPTPMYWCKQRFVQDCNKYLYMHNIMTYTNTGWWLLQTPFLHLNINMFVWCVFCFCS